MTPEECVESVRENGLESLFADYHHTMLWGLERFAGVFVAMGFASVTTVALLYLEQSLIANGKKELDEKPVAHLVDFVRVGHEVEVVTKKRKIKPPPPDEMPQLEMQPMQTNQVAVKSEWSITAPTDAVVPDIGSSGGFGFSDGDYLPLVKVAPDYPRKARVEGLSGWVVVEFTVTKSGNVVDPVVIRNCAVVQKGDIAPVCEDSPDTIFDRAALKAAKKFRYKPKVIDGEPIETAGVRNKITFEIGAS